MAKLDRGTEELIKSTAKRVFFVDGRLNATTQEIADAAGVTRTLLHYYFRSRDVLFQQVFSEAQQELAAKIDEGLGANLPVQKKIEHFIDVFFEHIIELPFMSVFMVQEINTNGLGKVFHPAVKHDVIDNFLKEVTKEMNKGKLLKMHPMNFMLNLLALITYPVMMKPLHLQVFSLTETEFNKLLKERKAMILRMIYK